MLKLLWLKLISIILSYFGRHDHEAGITHYIWMSICGFKRVLKSNLVLSPAAVSVQNNPLLSCLPDGKQEQSEVLLHTSSCCCPSVIILQHNTASLPCLSFAPQFSFQIHRSGSGPLQPLCALPIPLSSLCLPITSGETELPSQGSESTALPLVHVRPQ